MTPAVTALVEFVEELAEDGGIITNAGRLKLKALAWQVRNEDPLALAFERAVAGFRASR